MVTIKAYIKLYRNGRKSPFSSGYRPVFKFIQETATSGLIELIDREDFAPDDEGVVKITFLYREYLGNDFAEGKKFTFGEGRSVLGEGVVIEILN
jgi:GTPase